MQSTTVIFDMDGLLIDSEPLWQEAGAAMLQQFNAAITDEQYQSTTGLRTPEWLDYWFSHFDIDKSNIPEAGAFTERYAVERIFDRGLALPGVDYIMAFFQERGFKIGLASSSPMRLINVVIDKLNIRSFLGAAVSAELLDYGKPHPQVFLDCAAALQSQPVECICFEDSFNGMIAAKAARMKCVIVPAPNVHHESRWDAADMKLSSLLEFDDKKLAKLLE